MEKVYNIDAPPDGVEAHPAFLKRFGEILEIELNSLVASPKAIVERYVCDENFSIILIFRTDTMKWQGIMDGFPSLQRLRKCEVLEELFDLFDSLDSKDEEE